jgi:YgiT-type zinc finger domain-containing protein
MASKNSKKSAMVCDMCGKQGARVSRVTRSYGKGEDLLIIENVPVVSCPNCGETYLTSETLHKIHRIKLLRRELASPRPVPVAQYA